MQGFLGIPIAWLAAVLNVPKEVFLLASALPIAVSLYMVQRQRLGERVVVAFLVPAFKLSVDTRQIQAAYAVRQTWRDVQRSKKEEIADWTALYRMVQSVKEAVSDFNRCIGEHEGLVEQLRDWAQSPRLVSASVGRVSRMVKRHRELATRINSLVGKISDRSQQIRSEYASLLRREAAKREPREIEWAKLKSQLEDAERLVTPTFWAWVESTYRHQWLNAYERSYRHQREAISTWLAMPLIRPLLCRVRIAFSESSMDKRYTAGMERG